MDPLSITASCITLINLAGKIGKYGLEIKTGPENLNHLIRHVRYMRIVMEELQSTYDEYKDSTTWTTTFHKLSQADGPLALLHEVLKRITIKLEKEASAKGLRKVANRMAWPFEQTEIAKDIEIIEAARKLLEIAIDNDHVRLSQEMRKKLDLLSSRTEIISKGVEMLQTGQKGIERDRVLAFISSLDFQAKKQEYLEKRHEKSCSWFLNCSGFQNWLSVSGRTLICPGIPGAGKSVLSALVIDHLEQIARQGLLLNTHTAQNDSVVFIFCEYGKRESQDTTSLIRSMLKQLLHQREWTEQDFSIWQKIVEKGATMNRDEWLKLLADELTHHANVSFILDALDELNDGTRHDFTRDIRKLPPTLRMMVTTRPLANSVVEEMFPECFELELRAHEEDVLNYVHWRLHKSQEAILRYLHKHVKNNATLGKQIENAIAEKSQGMFLLPKFHIEKLAESAKRGYNALQNSLRTLPAAPDQLYPDIWRRILNQEADDIIVARRVLGLVYHAYVPMTMPWLQHFIAIQDGVHQCDEDLFMDPEYLISVCLGLVGVDLANGNLIFVHYTLKEHLDAQWRTYFPEAREDIARACMDYVSGDCFRSIAEDFAPLYDPNPPRNTFYEAFYSQHQGGTQLFNFWIDKLPRYIVCYLTDHLEGISNNEIIQQAIRLWHSETLITLRKAYFFFTSHTDWPLYAITDPDRMSELHFISGFLVSFEGYPQLNELQLAIFLNFRNEAKKLLKLNSRLRGALNPQYPPLCVAAARGDVELVSLLLKDDNRSGVVYAYNISRPPWSSDDSLDEASTSRVNIVEAFTALDCAIMQGHLDVVQCLVGDLDLLRMRIFECPPARTSIHLAARKGDVKIIEILLSAGAEIDAEDSDGKTPLCYVTTDGMAISNSDRAQTIRALVNAKANTNHDCFHEDAATPLQLACSESDSDLMQFLINHGADVNYRTPLTSACRAGFVEGATMLLRNGARAGGSNTNEERFYISPIEEASRTQHTELLELLLQNLPEEDNGSESVIAGDLSRALSRAFEEGRTQIMKRLLDYGVEPSIAESSYPHYYLERSHLDVYIEAIELQATSGSRLSVLPHQIFPYAIHAGYLNGIQRLLNDRLGPCTSDTLTTALKSACLKGQLEIAQLLVEKGATLEPGLLASAITYHHIDVAQYLFDEGARMEQDETFFDGVLASANEGDTLDIVKFIVKNGPKIYVHSAVTDSKLKSIAMRHAIYHDYAAIVAFLLDTGVDPNAKLEMGYETRTLICVAFMDNRVGTLKLLLTRNVDPNRAFADLGERAMTIAASHGSLEAARLLFEAGAQFEGDTGQRAALMAAAGNGNSLIVKVLLQKGAEGITDALGRARKEQARLQMDARDLLLSSSDEKADFHGVAKHLLDYGAEEPGPTDWIDPRSILEIYHERLWNPPHEKKCIEEKEVWYKNAK